MLQIGRRIVIAVGIGSFTGSYAALQMPRYWVLGILIGACTGYFAYRPMQVCRSIRRAFVQVFGDGRLGDRQYVLGMLRWSLGTVYYFAFPILLAFVAGNLYGDHFSFFVLFLVLSIVIGGLALVARAGVIASSKDNTGDITRTFFICMLIPPMNFICPLLYLAWAFFTTIPRVAARLPRFFSRSDLHVMDRARSIYGSFRSEIRLFAHTLGVIGSDLAKFVKAVYKMIHTDIRKLCMVDAAIGSVLGLALVNPLLGAIIGAAFGAFNYFIISLRVLELSAEEIKT